MFLKRITPSFLACCLVLLMVAVAQAIPITVNPGAYQGNWSLPGEHPAARSGIQTVNLAIGRKTIFIAGTNQLQLDISADGTVTPLNPVVASGGAGTVNFNTTNVFVDPLNYLGTWYINLVTKSGNNATAQNVTLVPGLSYGMQVAGPVNGLQNLIGFDVDGNGVITSGNPAAAYGGVGTFTFENMPIRVDPDGYQGSWQMNRVYSHGAWQPALTAPAEFIVVPNIEYGVIVATGTETVLVFVDATGNMSSNRPQSMTAMGSTLVFQTAPVVIDPQRYVGQWALSSVKSMGGLATINLVKETTYFLWPNGLSNPAAGNNGMIRVYLNEAGQLTSSWPTAVVASGDTLTFNNVAVRFDTAAYPGSWYLAAASSWQAVYGAQILELIPDWRYEIRVGSQSAPLDRFFYVGTTGQVTSEKPDSYTADGTNNVLSFNTVAIDLDPGLVLGQLQFNGIAYTTLSGPTTFDVVPGLNYSLWLNGYNNNTYTAKMGLPPFTISDPCTVSGFPKYLQNAAGATLDVSSWVWSCPETIIDNPPVADAGPDQNIYLGESAQLDGSASTDPDGYELISYRWTFTSAPAGSSYAAPGKVLAGMTPTFSPDLSGDYILSLVVNDGGLDSAAASVMISTSQNLAPLVNATADILSGTAPLTVNFDALASSDPENEAITFSWNFADPTTGIDNASTLVNPSHTFVNPGLYVVMVDVIDSFGNLTQGSVDIDVQGVVEPPPGDGGGNTLGFKVYEANIESGKKGKAEGKISLEVGFDNLALPTAEDMVVVSVEGIEVLNAPFAFFRKEDDHGEYEYKERNISVKLDMRKLRLKVTRHKMILSGIDNSDGITVKISIGTISGTETAFMNKKNDDRDDDHKLSCKKTDND